MNPIITHSLSFFSIINLAFSIWPPDYEDGYELLFDV